MSRAPAQPVGDRVRFPQPSASSRSSGLHGSNGDLFTPARPNTVVSSPFRTVLRRTARVDPEPSVNPFTPRPDRAASPVSTRPIARRNTTGLGTGLRSGKGAGYLTGLDKTPSLRLSLSRGNSSEDADASMRDDRIGGVGAWPTETFYGGDPSTLGLGGTSSAMPGDDTPITPFGRPRSPAPRSVSPHKTTKKLPSFLLGSTQTAKPATSATPFQPDSALTTASQAPSSVYGIPSAVSTARLPLSSHPISPRVSRRISGFGSNDMLSSAYKSSAITAGGGGASGIAASLEDAPPVMTLDDMDEDKHDAFLSDEDTGAATQNGRAGSFAAAADPFASIQEPRSAEAGPNAADGAGKATSGDKDYDDVKLRSIVVAGIPAESESGVLNQFRVYGEILAFAVSPVGPNSLAILYSEPWQAQRAIAQGGNAGRILIRSRNVVSVSWADAESIAILFKQVFPGRAVPESVAQPSTRSFTLSQTIYAQSPRKRPLSSAHPSDGGLRIDKIRETEVTRNGRQAGSSSPFRQQQFSSMGRLGTRETTGASTSLGASGSVLRAQTAPRPRNGLLQSALDILFGW
ncbi:hypothetical protein LPJ72_000039 [Coemansia sp. Benny D160-2]|nr:hypothetical protein LPJ72_000039 [Coemansia sp. Benny D160-2]